MVESKYLNMEMLSSIKFYIYTYVKSVKSVTIVLYKKYSSSWFEKPSCFTAQLLLFLLFLLLFFFLIKFLNAALITPPLSSPVSLISQKRRWVTPQIQWKVLREPAPLYAQQPHNSGSWRPPEEQPPPSCPPACPQKVPCRHFFPVTEGGNSLLTCAGEVLQGEIFSSAS